MRTGRQEIPPTPQFHKYSVLIKEITLTQKRHQLHKKTYLLKIEPLKLSLDAIKRSFSLSFSIPLFRKKFRISV